MRIGIYDPYLDDLGGGEKYILTLAECLASNNIVSLFWDNRNDLEELKTRFGLSLNNILLKKNIFSTRVSFLERIIETRKYDAIIFLSDGSIPFSLSKKLFVHFQQPLEHIDATNLKNKIKLSRITGIFYNSMFT